jgi:hypothetical protein
VIVASIGCALVVIAMGVVGLEIIDKPHFGGLVGPWFLEVITSGVIVGSLMLLMGAFMLPEKKTWRGITLILWGLIGVTSPLFGLMFLFPWGLLALSLPLVVAILMNYWKRTN